MPFLLPALLLSAAAIGGVVWWTSRDDGQPPPSGGYLPPPAPIQGGFRMGAPAPSYEVLTNPDGTHALVFDITRDRWLSPGMVAQLIQDRGQLLPADGATSVGLGMFQPKAPTHRLVMGGQSFGNPADPLLEPANKAYFTVAGPAGRKWMVPTPAGRTLMLVFRGATYSN